MKKTLVILIALFSVALTACVAAWQQQGYTNEADYNFAKTLGNSTPQRIARLKAYGILTKADVDKVDLEITSTGYSNKTDWDTTFLYLKDREDAKKAGISLTQQRDSRLAAERKAEQQRLAEEKKRREDFAKEYPYEAILACEFQGRNIGNIAVCFVGGRGSSGTELSLRNGNSVRVYKGYELQNLGREGQDGLRIPLRERFEIKAQNESKDYVLTLAVRRTATGEVVLKQAAGMYKVVSARN